PRRRGSTKYEPRDGPPQQVSHFREAALLRVSRWSRPGRWRAGSLGPRSPRGSSGRRGPRALALVRFGTVTRRRRFLLGGSRARSRRAGVWTGTAATLRG